MKIIQGEAALKKYIETILVPLYKNHKLFPFIGAGFTKGENAKRNSVPDASQTKEKMVELICANESNITSSDMVNLDFQKISNYFYKYVPKAEINNFLINHFTCVKISEKKKNLLSLNWQNIYTLNVDDAIERNSTFAAIMPYREINRDVLIQKVFKLHGDANHEITYLDDPNIIFGRDQYIKSLTENTSILSCFREDYLSNNFLFIGCSLDNELDLEYAIKKIELKGDNSKIERAYLTNQEPSFMKKSELEDFGINTIIVVESFDFFYALLFDCLSIIHFDEYSILDEFKNVKINKYKDLESNKAQLISIQNLKTDNRVIKVPYYFTERTLLHEIISKYTDKSLNIIVGRRLSGKTFLAADIASRVINRDVYLFSSNITISKVDIDRLLKLSNILMIFDTNTVGYDEIKFLADSKMLLEKNSNHVIMFLNSSDRLLLSIPSTMLDFETFYLNNKFDDDELEEINDKLSSIGLIKLKGHKTILDNVYAAKENYGVGFKYQLNSIVSSLTEKDLKILILSASSDKIYSSVYRNLGIIEKDLVETISKIGSGALIEIDYTEAIESFQHAGWKTIVNSKVYLFRILGQYVEEGNRNIGRVSEYIFDIVSILNTDCRFSSFTKNLTLFDNLNQIFWKKEGGVINLIFKIYEKLECILYKESQYWIQRAKSILYLKQKNEKELLKALTFAQKSYHDSVDNSNTQIQSSFLMSMIYGRLAHLSEFKNSTYLTESVNWYYSALQEYSYNHKYITDFINRARRDKGTNDFYALCHYYISMEEKQLKGKDSEKINYLVNKLLKWE